MKLFCFTLCLTGVFASAAMAQQPAVTSLANNYSYILPGLPNYGIAQGSIFDIFGSNLAPASPTPTLQSVPLKTTVNGVTVNVTVSGTTVHPIIYYASPTQINAILPSATPVGTGTITVTNNGSTSASAPIQVVASAFGLMTLSGAGTGPAAAFNASNGYAYLGYTAAANPGDTIVLWGTGLGPASGDETVAQTQTSLTNLPFEVTIGGTVATAPYHGRSQFPGLDQVNVVVPSGVTGCNVSVVIKTGNYVSNFVTIPIAASGRTCSDPNSGLSASQLQDITNKGSFSYGSIGLSKSTVTTPGFSVGGVTIPGSTTTSESGYAGFTKLTLAQFNAGAYVQAVSMGSCSVYVFSGNSASAILVQYQQLNAGANVNITGPNGNQAMPFKNGSYSGSFTNYIPASGGTFKFDNGGGGPDVGPFSVQLSVPAPLVWTNMSSITTVNRSQGVTVNWTGGDSNGLAIIGGVSVGSLNGSTTQFVGGAFSCTAPVSAKQFTVPSNVLLSLPPSFSQSVGGVTISAGSSLYVGTATTPQSFTATGVDSAFATATFESINTVTYQ